MFIKNNIILIGMPGSGKSTIGVLLAKETAKDYIDTDVLIQVLQKKTLQQIINESSHMNLRHIEENVLLSLKDSNKIIATGGSAAYSEKAMQHLKKNGHVIFLNVRLDELNNRIHNFNTRGIAMNDDQSFQDLFNERFPLYQKYADFMIETSDMSQEQVVLEVLAKLK
jgi:shikimate kinase